MKKFFLFLIALPFFAVGQTVWSPFSMADATSGERLIHPEKCALKRLDFGLFRKKMEAAPDWLDQSQLADNQGVMIELPMPDGSFETFEAFRADVLHPDLAARFPSIKSYFGKAKSGGRAISVRFDATDAGFHGLLFLKDGNSVFIDPLFRGETAFYQSYFKSDFVKKGSKKTQSQAFSCLTGDAHEPKGLPATVDLSGAENVQGDCGKLRRYRLALACTGEYATFHGGTVAGALAAMTTTMARINGVYEKDLGVTMQIVPNNNLVCFLNSATDPYDNDDVGQMYDQNQSTCETLIGAANFDMGHVFGTAGGGVACLECVCSGSRARGVTGVGSPVGDPFDIDYVAHEMGHQFGGRHTQNNSCNRDNSASMEPGSGSTIMSYAGICNPNVSAHSDAYFHAINLQHMSLNVVSGTSSTCPTQITVANTAPTATVSVNRIIPISTPFALVGSATDAENDVLTFCWEQMEPDAGAMPPQPTNTVGPMFRSLPPVSSGTRFIPRPPVLAGITTSVWEALPNNPRTMKFRMTVRDNHMGGGCTEEADMSVTTAGTVPFAVLYPSAAGIVWEIGKTEIVTWDVAGTNLPPFNSQTMNIVLSTDGGLTFPYKILGTTPNDGSEAVTVPNLPSTTCRIKVEADDNVFFDISDNDFVIKAPTVASFLIEALPQKLTVCAGVAPMWDLTVTPLAGFSGQVTMSATVPAGFTAEFSQNPVLPPTFLKMSLKGQPTGPNPGGPFTITITGTSGAITQSIQVKLEILPSGPTAQVTGLSPANGAANTSTSGPLSWAADALATSYLIELASSPSFSAASILLSQEVFTNSFSPNLAASTVYYWRVRAKNVCGLGPWSAFSSFQTFSVQCATTASTDVPKAIDTPGPAVVNSVLNIAAGVNILDLDVYFKANHTWLGDIKADLIPPTGPTIPLFDRPGSDGMPTSFGCQNDNIEATFDDEATSTATDLEAMCNAAPPAVSGTFQPITALSQLDGLSSQGTWTMRVTDAYPTEDVGTLLAWSLKICRSGTIPAAALLKNLPLNVVKSGSGVVSKSLLEAPASANALFTITVLPASGVLSINGAAAAVGATFTQNDINNGLVTYQHGGASSPVTDQFGFDVLFQAGGNWLAGQLFLINIIQNTLAATLSITSPILCNNQSTGSIAASATGGAAPLSYSLNGGVFQSQNAFSNLSAGTFTVVVKDANGFTATAGTVVLTNPPLLTVAASVNNSNLSATATGGTGAKTYSLNGGVFSGQNTWPGLPNGTYTIVARDANGCTATTTATILINTLAISATATGQILCFGGANGQITALASGGQMPFLYALNGGSNQTSTVFSGLSAGSYTVVVTDQNGFTATTNAVNLTNPPQLLVSATVAGSTITVTATGGTGAKQYALNSGTYGPNNVFSNLANGAYLVSVLDANGCLATTQVVIAVNTLAVAAQPTQAVLCNGGSTGQITVSVGGGQSPFSYRLNGGAAQPSNVFSNLSAGNYTVVVTDGQGFTATTNSVVLGNPPLLTISVSVNNSTITATGGGGTPGLQYGLNGQNFSSNNVFSNLVNGQYTVTVRDANNCLASATATVLVNTLAVSAAASAPITCFNGANGQITVTVGGGTPAFFYSINGGTSQPSNIFSNLAAGSYTVVVTDSQGFTKTTNTVILSNPAQVQVSATANLLTITASATGGTGGLTYSIDGQNFQASGVFTVTQNGTFTITVRDQNFCTATTTVVVNVPPLAATASVSSQIQCFGDQNGEITASASGGIAPYQFSLNGISYQSSPVFQNLGAAVYTIYVKDAMGTVVTHSTPMANPPNLTINVTVIGNDIQIVSTGGAGGWTFSLDGITFFNNFGFFSDLSNGTHVAYVRDFAGCLKSKTFTINNQPPTFVATVTNAPCFGQTGSILVAASGTNPPFQYSLDNQNWQNSDVFAGLLAGTYTVWVRDNLDQKSSQTIVVNEPPQIIVTAQVNVSTVTVTASGGTGNFNYALDGGSAQASNVFLLVSNGTHTVSVNDGSGCTASAQVNIGANTIAVAAENFVPISCFGATDGGFEICVNGGTPPFSVQVSPNVGVQTQIQGGCALNFRLSGLPAGNYQIVVTDVANFSKTLSIGLTQPLGIAVSVNLTGGGNDAVIDAMGGTGNFTYALDGQNFQPSNVFPDLLNGQYLVTVKDQNGCTATQIFEINTIATEEPMANDWAVSIQPNPTDGAAQLIDNERVTSDFEVKISDATGRLLFFFDKASLPFSLQLETLPSGVYWVSINDGKRSATKKLVKI